MIYLITAPSGAGKNFLVSMLGYTKIITFTTRTPREGEKNMIDYFFVSERSFKDLETAGVMAETTLLNGHYYGTPKARLHRPGNYSLIVEPEGSHTLGKYMDSHGIEYRRVWIDTPLCLRHIFISNDKSRSEHEIAERVFDGIKERWNDLGLTADITLPMADYPFPQESIA